MIKRKNNKTMTIIKRTLIGAGIAFTSFLVIGITVIKPVAKREEEVKQKELELEANLEKFKDNWYKSLEGEVKESKLTDLGKEITMKILKEGKDLNILDSNDLYKYYSKRMIDEAKINENKKIIENKIDDKIENTTPNENKVEAENKAEPTVKPNSTAKPEQVVKPDPIVKPEQVVKPDQVVKPESESEDNNVEGQGNPNIDYNETYEEVMTRIKKLILSEFLNGNLRIIEPDNGHLSGSFDMMAGRAPSVGVLEDTAFNIEGNFQPLREKLWTVQSQHLPYITLEVVVAPYPKDLNSILIVNK